MKTTLDIQDALLEAARKVARRERTTLRALVEQGLRLALDQRRARPAAFALRDASVGGAGLQSDVRGLGWERLRELAYGTRGA